MWTYACLGAVQPHSTDSGNVGVHMSHMTPMLRTPRTVESLAENKVRQVANSNGIATPAGRSPLPICVATKDLNRVVLPGVVLIDRL